VKHPDPYEGMSDEEFHAWAERMLASAARSRSRPVTMRMPEALIERTKRAAGRAGMPYQVLIRRLVEAGLDQLERERGSGPAAAGRRPRTRTPTS
jgi:predicted DNA binding CopG/RHH family protein